MLLKVARTSLGLSIHELSIKSSISEKTIKGYEDEVVEPDIPKLVQLVTTLQIPFEEVDIKEEDVSLCEDNISYNKKYTRNHESYFFGTCKCGRSYFVKEIDVYNSLRTKCKYCTVKEINGSPELSMLTREDIERLDTLYQNKIVKRSIKLNVNCTITLQDYVKLIVKDCYYCGAHPSQVAIINNKRFIHNGIDRLDSSLGYEKNNVVPCCATCNMAKGSLEEKEFLKLIENIYKNHNK